MGFFEWDPDMGPEPDDDLDLTMQVEPGMCQELPPGVTFKESNPNYPNGELQIFSKSMLRGIASGLGVAYNSLANDLEGVNFSSIRQGALDEREFWKERQEWFIESFMEPIFELWLPVALLGNRIKIDGNPLRPEKIDKYREVQWQPRRWQWIDPRADVNAAIESKNNLLTSPGQIIRDQGRDPSSVWREISNDIDQMKQAGIPEEYIKIALGQKGDFNATADKAETND
jgi:lambda family phage portal protein